MKCSGYLLRGSGADAPQPLLNGMRLKPACDLRSSQRRQLDLMRQVRRVHQ